MRRSIATGVLALAMATSAQAQTQVIRPDDGAMTCVQIGEEAAMLSAGMGDEARGGLFSSLVGVAKAGASMVVPGAGLAVAAGDAVTQPGRERREATEEGDRHRWYYLNGLYAGMRCNAAQAAQAAPAPSTPQTPAPTPAPAPSVAVTPLSD